MERKGGKSNLMSAKDIQEYLSAKKKAFDRLKISYTSDDLEKTLKDWDERQKAKIRILGRDNYFLLNNTDGYNRKLQMEGIIEFVTREYYRCKEDEEILKNFKIDTPQELKFRRNYVDG